jgi:hypothetical protein
MQHIFSGRLSVTRTALGGAKKISDAGNNRDLDDCYRGGATEGRSAYAYKDVVHPAH